MEGGGEDEEDEDGDDLAERLGSIDIESASASDIWNALTPEERKDFMNKFRDPTSTSAQEFLRSAGLEADIILPWWLAPDVPLDEDVRTSRTQKYGERPKMEIIPDALLSRTSGPHTGPPLLYNICAVFIAYAYVTRHLGISPLSALRDEDEKSSARQLMRELAPFLVDKRSTTLFVSMDDVVTDSWQRLVGSQKTGRTSFVVLLRDAARLLAPRRVTVVESSITRSSSGLEETPQRDALLALSDLITLFTIRGGVAKETPASHKLRFYAALIASLPAQLLAAFSAEVSARARSVEVEGQQFVQASEDPSSELRTSASKERVRTKPRPVIEEL
ncbi:uncharacterized protein FOMMEDRAFT_137674, partial [Fomitiporia mediterranea MF3/22]|uniref:uncharacterized protein n=1 Tax=Fomitiporia mediterranea (strain MF3/22) TaxID=694068 RepID=UPI0004409427